VPIDEGIITFARIKELEESPVVGRFDTAHLCDIHRRIFQDLPHYRPGQFRPAASTWMKARELESGELYYVPYAPQRVVELGLNQVLKNVCGPRAFANLSLDQFAVRMAGLYGDLDYLHPFSEGNSRTLRTFTRQLSREAGFDLEWSPSHADPLARDQLYRARDAAVIHRAFPDLDERRAMETDDPTEYEAYWVLQELQRSPSLDVIVREYTTLHPERKNRDGSEDEYELE